MYVKFTQNVNFEGVNYTSDSESKAVTAETGASLIAAGLAVEVDEERTNVTYSATEGLMGPDGVIYTPGFATSGVPATTLTDIGIGTTETQIAVVTIPGGIMGPYSILEVFTGYTMTGNDSKLMRMKAGPASGNYASATAFSGRSGLTTHKWDGVLCAIWNTGTLGAQKATALNQPGYLGSSTATPLVAMSIDTSLDWNIYFGVQFGVAGGSPMNSATLENYFINIKG